MSGDEEIDSQLQAEYIGFLDQCFDNSFTLKCSLKTVKTLKEDLDAENNYFQSQSSKSILRCSKINPCLRDGNENVIETHASIIAGQVDKKELRAWGLPEDIVTNYESKGIRYMFEWQVECLSNSKVLLDYANLVYSAPTSAGKTLVAELLAIKTVLERQKKVIVILPFVSVVREKMFYLQNILSSAGVRVEGFMGSHAPPGGFQAVHMAICTIEKANSIVNRLMDEGNMSELGAVVVDEMHLLGDSSRGYILELLLTKIKYLTKKHININIQIIGMSATLPNLRLLSNWLDAELFVTDFRPIPLEEYCLVGNNIIDRDMNVVRKIETVEELSSGGDNILQICLDTLREGCSVLIFCTTKNWCENLAQLIASTFFKMGSSNSPSGKLLREQLNSESIAEVLEQLKSCPVGLDAVLKTTVSFAVAFHHAGLTYDERDIVEGAFKSGTLRVLVATSTLSSGVNLPARRVIIRSPVFQKQAINILTYKQMIGRAGRMGKDTKGESILICSEAEKKIGLELMSGALDPVKSCIEGGDKYMRAILEVIASQVASTKSELDLYTNCTLLFHENRLDDLHESLLDETLACLVEFELVRIQGNADDTLYLATPLGKACLSSSMAPNDGLSLFCELQKARQCLVLETDLHLLYLVTPYSVSGQWPNIDWLHLLNLWESLPKAMKRVGELVGVQESFLFQCVRGTVKFDTVHKKVQIHKRFYTALALQDLVNEVSLGEVAVKFRCCRGLLQSLQQSAATFAGMVTAFCHQLGWRNIKTLVSQFQDRLYFGIQSELLDLMRLSSLNGLRARSLFNAGFESVCTLASAEVNMVENALYLSVPFQSEKGREGDDATDAERRNKVKNIWITGHCGMTAKQAAENLINEARTYLQFEMGVSEIKWKQVKEDSKLKISIENSQKELKCINYDISVSNEKQVIDVSPKNNVKDFIKINISTNNLPVQSHESPGNVDFRSSNENKKKDNICETNQHSLIDEEMWDTLDLREIKSIDKSKGPHSVMLETILSPFCALQNGLSLKSSELFKDTTRNKTNRTSSSNNITPDVSMFPTDDPDSPNLFEESLTVDTQLCKLVDDGNMKSRMHNNTRKRKMELDISSLNYNSLKDVFISTFDISKVEAVIATNNENDIRLHYEDDVNVESDSSQTCFNDSTNEDITSCKERDEISSINTTLSCDLHSLRSNVKSTSKCETQTKKVKIYHKHCAEFWNLSSDSKLKHVHIPSCNNQRRKRKLTSPKINVNDCTLTCIIIGCGQYIDFLKYLDQKKHVALFLNISEKIDINKPLIGSKVVKKSEQRQETESILNKIEIKNSVLKGVSLCLSENICFYIDFTTLYQYLNIIFKKIKSWLSKADVNVYIHSYKFNHVYLKRCNIELPTTGLDTSLMEWLIDSDTIETSITRLITKYFERDIDYSFEVTEDSSSQHNKISDELLTCVKAWGLMNVAGKQINYLSERYSKVYQVLGIETQVAKILSESESYGLRVDKELASRLLVDVKQSQEVLQAKAYKIYGRRFNFNSSKEVAKALGIYNGRKVSTKKSVLSAHNSPLASIIAYWRKLNSILTRTLYPLNAKALSCDSSRIHTSYITHTCTGRVCMHEPNLQNVPRNFTIPASFLTHESGNNVDISGDVIEFSCRSIFLASPGWIIVSADYCQLEMRILTHLCGDEVLMAIMNSDVDVFTSIAASWASLPEEHVDDDLRQKAKQMCYGIIYGMGNRTLAQQLDVTELEAAVFMDTFHKKYPAIKLYTQKVIDGCKERGYVETIKKRRRYLPTINSKKIAEKNSAERQAVNTTIQGSAADIAKAAMCAVDEHVSLCGESSSVRLMLQLHDELIYEVLDSKLDFFLDTLKQAMEQAEKLSVPLPVKIKFGHSWGSLEQLKT